jgi:low affinity Fe/Cu permease
MFNRFASLVSTACGSSTAFALAFGLIAVWLLLGPFFGFSEAWQLWINTGTTVITFLMVFLVQATQNRDSKALHLKLDELLRAVREARNGLIGLEHLSDAALDKVEHDLHARKTTLGVPTKKRRH